MSRLSALLVMCSLLAGCNGPKPFLMDGDATSAEVGYAMDPATTMPIAREHCAAYERVPRLVQAQNNIAYYDCVRP